MEIWKDIKGYEGLYQISNLGNIRSLDKKIDDYRGKETRTMKGRLLKPFKDTNGYLMISLVKNKVRKNFYIHRLIASAFIAKPYGKNIVNHKDYNIKNNSIDNLEWVTQKENVRHSICNMKKRRKVTHSNTQERYISYRKSKGVYRVTIDRKEYSSFKTLQEAIKERDKILYEKECNN